MADRPPVHVVAAAITDPRGRVLLSRRTVGRDLAGLWEFPGGKVEPGETPEQALVRELQEELGIHVQPGAHLITVPQAYPNKRLRLDVRLVSAWKGVPRGQEGQALAWVPLHKLASYAMPPADIPVVAALTAPDCYLVTPAPGQSDGRPQGSLADTAAQPGADAAQDAQWLQDIQRALASGIRRLHLRLPDAGHSSHAFCAVRRESLLRQALALAHAAGAQAFLSGDIELARATGAGVHLRSSQLAQLQQRPLPTSLPLAASCHDEAELQHAQRLGCDFALLGPVMPTPSHPGAPGLGWTRFAALRETVSLPIYAIGGLTPAHIPQARQHGAQGIAAIRALWPSAN
ncbi:8-oxo-dGTP diphosphatase MutT [Luteimonas sp. A277]